MIGQNRYLISAEITSSSQYGCFGKITIGKGMFSILKEIANTTYTVKCCTDADTSFVCQLSGDDIAIIAQFVSDLEASGLADQLPDDTVISITQYN